MFGGGFYSSVNSTNITVKAIDCHDIFGGGFMGDVEESTNVIIGEDNSKTTTTSGNETSGDETSGTDTTTSGNNTSGNHQANLLMTIPIFISMAAYMAATTYRAM